MLSKMNDSLSFLSTERIVLERMCYTSTSLESSKYTP